MMMPSIFRLLSLVVAAGLSASALAVEGDWGQVAQALGKSGSEMPGGVYRIGLPRTDLKVVLDGVELKPAVALGSWLAFRSEGDQALVMGDLVLTADKLQARKRAAENRIENTLVRTLPSQSAATFAVTFVMTSYPAQRLVRAPLVQGSGTAGHEAA
jgi:hypothetical protein